MITAVTGSRQPQHVAWSQEWLVHERAIALGNLIDSSSALTYNSHLQSYLTFCKLHKLPVNPTPETLSFYVVFMCHHINPHLVGAYLSGICNTLEPHFEEVRKARMHPIVTCTLNGMKKMRGNILVRRKRALTSADLEQLFDHFDTGMHDDTLFLTITLTGFHAILRLGEMTQPDS